MEFLVIGDKEIDPMSRCAGKMNGIGALCLRGLPNDRIAVCRRLVEGDESGQLRQNRLVTIRQDNVSTTPGTYL